jgi:hypothetical protein
MKLKLVVRVLLGPAVAILMMVALAATGWWR